MADYYIAEGSLEDIATKATSGFSTKIEKAETIYDWMRKNIQYDYDWNKSLRKKFFGKRKRGSNF